MNKKLEGIKMSVTWLSYVGAAHGIMEHAGLWKGDIACLAGLCGLAFRFVIHKKVCPSSVTVYDWGQFHWSAMDRIGVYTDSIAVYRFAGMNTGEQLISDAAGKIRESIDRGIAVLAWAPTPILEFGIITGYDDGERFFPVIDCANPDPDPLLYDNLGRSEVPFLYVQRFLSATKVDREKAFRDALGFAAMTWDAPHPNEMYGQGSAAWDNLINALESNTFEDFGLCYVVNTYADAKKQAALFLQKASETGIKGLDEAAEQMGDIAVRFSKMAEAVPFHGPMKTHVDKAKIPDMAKIAKACRKLEAQAMKEIAAATGRRHT